MKLFYQEAPQNRLMPFTNGVVGRTKSSCARRKGGGKLALRGSRVGCNVKEESTKKKNSQHPSRDPFSRLKNRQDKDKQAGVSTTKTKNQSEPKFSKQKGGVWVGEPPGRSYLLVWGLVLGETAEVGLVPRGSSRNVGSFDSSPLLGDLELGV